MLMSNLVPQCHTLRLHRADFLTSSSFKEKERHVVQCCSEANLAFLSLETTTYVILVTLCLDKQYSLRY